MKISLSFLIVISCLTSCSNRESKNSEIYLGTYRVADRVIPYPFILKHARDSVFLFDASGASLDNADLHSMKKGGEIILGEKHLKILDKNESNLILFDLLDTISFRTYSNGKPNIKYAAKFQKLLVEDELDLQKLGVVLQKSIWKYELQEGDNSNPNHDLDIKQSFNFKEDSVNIITNYYYQTSKMISEYETKAYQIFEIDGIYFLSLRKENDNPQLIYRLKGFNSQNIELEDYSSKVSKSLSLQKDTLSIDGYRRRLQSTAAYANCYDGYQGEYYYEDVTFNKGNEFIAEYVSENLPQTESKSGYIIIHFNINCSGNLGDFGLILMDKSFNESVFSIELVKHIINKVSELNDFPPSASQREWLQFKDVHSFLMFKIERGKITDVSP
ncbi:hypothetical protein [uncultured Marivirga sp.]|uniref:hypothetical protein n=1 Tax=uncultured Marivirga sp. TaxID=1123707 RepID=UPI0030EECB13|tara:strand:+ start:47497 stop:48657 length:1161 start_codon:yes stop_codon:yes gene_type:complete